MSDYKSIMLRTSQIPVNKNLVKLAVLYDEKIPQLIEFDQEKPLIAIIQDICAFKQWNLPDPESYSLKYEADNNKIYITEKNRSELKNGQVLRLILSAARTAEKLIETLQSNAAAKRKEALQQLQGLASDFTFALDFINKQGLALLISFVEEDRSSGEALAYVLQTFVELMDHGVVSWDILEHRFISRVAALVGGHSAKQDAAILKGSLAILESVVQNGSDAHRLVVEQEVTLANLVAHLESPNAEIQLNAIALVNALFAKADGAGRQRRVADELTAKNVRGVILSNVLQGARPVGSEMGHQLYVLQTLFFNLMSERVTRRMDAQDQAERDKIVELRKIAFDNEGEAAATAPSSHTPTSRRQGSYAKDYKKLGFANHSNPAEDFTETPPGLLALDLMYYFACSHTDGYTKVVLENACRADEHECPFAKSSIELTKMLCADILKVGEPPSDEGALYYPMFVTQERAFEEFFCICIQTLNKTWKEMRATAEDFAKVLSVVREQIVRALREQPTNLDQFRARIAKLTYAEITALWQQERIIREEDESQARPILELREQITPEIVELVRQQRLSFLAQGTLFSEYSGRGQRQKNKFWYCRLSPNHKHFHYGDCDESARPSLEELDHKIAVVDVKQLVTGRDCPIMKNKSKTTIMNLAFSIVLDGPEPQYVNFVAPTDQIFNMWTDGVNALLGNQMTSQQTKEDLDILLNMEIKLRLLDTEGITIPDQPPPVPSDPSNYDFAYD
ncbi:PREDICTED: engulfment and cell motility protein 1-like [Priapulus caudatus]|uniref:Engulfment and cell motility protein 1-like n=1 Tax=Priapulus caudatus TaxID=37621 RepID=A0ABM1FBV7_PRICU|nr:PREDICTED: engulfment and cell motility protein 1-like [Priapulus caudatus]